MDFITVYYSFSSYPPLKSAINFLWHERGRERVREEKEKRKEGERDREKWN